MLAVLSPAKRLDTETDLPAIAPTQPRFLERSAAIVDDLRQLSSDELGELMSISANLAELNADRFQRWQQPFTPDNAHPAIFTFAGDVYMGLEAASLTVAEVHAAQRHLRILSGLYGVLRPLDLMQPYRLEMGCPYNPDGYNSLAAHWREPVTECLNRDLKDHRALVDLASREYAAAIDTEALEKPLIKVDFKEEKEGKLRVLAFFAKKARGMMARHIATTEADSLDELRAFDAAGYRYRDELSSEHHLVFSRPQP